MLNYALPYEGMRKMKFFALMMLLAGLLSAPALAQSGGDCQCVCHYTFPTGEGLGQDLCSDGCVAMGGTYGGYDGTNQCTCNSMPGTCITNLPNWGDLGGNCDCGDNGPDPDPVPEMEAFLIPAFLVGGALLIRRQRRKALGKKRDN